MDDKQFADLKNTIMEHSCYNECAITDSVYETTDKIISDLKKIQEEYRHTQATLDRIEKMLALSFASALGCLPLRPNDFETK